MLHTSAPSFRPVRAALPHPCRRSRLPRPLPTPQATKSTDSAPPSFNLPLAVALAGCTFQAYLQPVGAEGYQDVALNDTKTVFTDRSFLEEMFEGILYIELVGGAELRGPDASADPYVVMTVNNSTAKSKVVNRSINPQWKERFFLYVKSVSQDVVKIRLYSKGNFFQSDQDLGFTMLPMRDLADGMVHELELPLSGSGSNPNAKVKVKTTMMRFSDFSETALSAMTTSKMDVPVDGGPGKRAIPGMMDAVVQSRLRIQQGGGVQVIGSIFDNLGVAKDRVSKAMESVSKLAGWDKSDPTPPNPWKALADMASQELGSFAPVAFVENLLTDTQVWLFRNVETKEAVISFRGTEQTKWKDVATDASFAPISFNVERVDDNAGLPFTMRVIKAITPNAEVNIHSGFLTAYDSIRQPVVRLLDAITGTGEKGEWRVYVTGHSLGGALATVCTYELAARSGPARLAQNVAMYSFGAPRVGNKAFAQKFESIVPDSWRVINTKDIIPSIPRLMGYTHVKHSVSISKEGQLLVQRDDGGRDVFGEGRAGVEVIQELVDRIQSDPERWEDVYEEIKAKEMAILDTLRDGTALEEHMETFYMETLKQCVLSSTRMGGGGGDDSGKK